MPIIIKLMGSFDSHVLVLLKMIKIIREPNQVTNEVTMLRQLSNYSLVCFYFVKG